MFSMSKRTLSVVIAHIALTGRPAMSGKKVRSLLCSLVAFAMIDTCFASMTFTMFVPLVDSMAARREIIEKFVL